MFRKAALALLLLCAPAFGAAAFDNTNDNIRSGTVSVATNITIEVLVYSDSYAQNSTVINKEPLNSNWWIGTTVTDILFRGGKSGSDLTAAITNCTDGEWCHIAVTAAGTSGEIYVGGVSKASGTIVAIGNTGGVVNIGNFDINNNFVWDGRIAYVRLWSDVRTSDELNTYMYRRVAGNEPNLIRNWPMDEQTGTTAADHQTNVTASNGTLELFAAGSEWGDNGPTTHGE